jgi:TetR/AcrR family transcriptional regulator
MSRPPRASRDRILAAAAGEFAAHGYAGARVDRIARRARVNKAMLYYHFRSKQSLYRTLLRQTFSDAALRLAHVAGSNRTPREQLDLAVAGVAALVREHAFFPAIMLREIAEGGAHLDRETLAAMAGVPRAVGAIVQRGIDQGMFRRVHPLAAYFSLLAPLVMFMAGARIRREIASRELPEIEALTPDVFVAHMQEMMRRGLSDLSPSTNAGAAQ